jgi:hypothetical protein
LWRKLQQGEMGNNASSQQEQWCSSLLALLFGGSLSPQLELSTLERVYEGTKGVEC